MEHTPGLTSLETLQKIQKDMKDPNIEPGNFEDGNIFISMFNDIHWTKRRNSERCISNSEKAKEYARRFSQRDVSGSWRRKEVVWKSSLLT